jgi:hypothetical protein
MCSMIGGPTGTDLPIGRPSASRGGGSTMVRKMTVG